MKTIQTVSEEVFDAGETILDEVMEGLNRTQKTLPSKFFYDERGSRLFETITDLPEYYLTRTEIKIIRKHIDEIVWTLGPAIRLIEPGSGNSRKTRLLLDHIPDICAYIPVEISATFLSSVTAKLSDQYPGLNIIPVADDYTRQLKLPAEKHAECRDVVFFPGSTIGNFTPGQAQSFLAMVAGQVKDNGGLLIGTDLKKDPEILEAAYNDSKGVTAEFNKNLLVRLNRELGTNFNISQFEHRAVYNSEKSRIEMHLVSLVRQKVNIGKSEVSFRKGEYIHTENSYKYSLKKFKTLASPYFNIEKVWTDEHGLFAVQYLVPR